MRTTTIINGYNERMGIYAVRITVKNGRTTTELMRTGKNYAEVRNEAIKDIVEKLENITEIYNVVRNGKTIRVNHF